MLIAEFTVDHPVLGHVLESVPEIELEWEETYDTRGAKTQMLFWVRSTDFEAVETAMDDDSTVENRRVLTSVGTRRLYRVDVTEIAQPALLMPELMKIGGVLVNAVGTNSGWRYRARFPNREAYHHVFEFCRDRDMDFTFERIYSTRDIEGGNETPLTDAQRKTLVEAVESGYLEIPRKCSLSRLGDRLGISETAASERFRRAVKNLTEQTVYRGDR